MTLVLPDYSKLLEFGELHVKFDLRSQLVAMVIIHSTKLGPALGGCRFISYKTLDDAIMDCARLARGMSYKSACAGLALGGGKAVIIKPDPLKDRDLLFKTFGKFVNDLGGRYITAVDSGSTMDDIETIATQTPYRCGVRADGDPSPHTAQGVFKGIQAAVKFKLNRDDLKGIHVVIQGLGNVGLPVAHHLKKAGAQLTVFDIRKEFAEQCAKELGATLTSAEECHKLACDVFAPCALGGIINDKTINEFNCKIIAGAANNQLLEPRHGDLLAKRGILYAPDYVINAGGIIHCEARVYNRSDKERIEKINAIYQTLLNIFDRAHSENLSPAAVADLIAQEKLQ